MTKLIPVTFLKTGHLMYFCFWIGRTKVPDVRVMSFPVSVILSEVWHEFKVWKDGIKKLIKEYYESQRLELSRWCRPSAEWPKIKRQHSQYFRRKLTDPTFSESFLSCDETWLMFDMIGKGDLFLRSCASATFLSLVILCLRNVCALATVLTSMHTPPVISVCFQDVLKSRQKVHHDCPLTLVLLFQKQCLYLFLCSEMLSFSF